MLRLNPSLFLFFLLILLQGEVIAQMDYLPSQYAILKAKKGKNKKKTVELINQNGSTLEYHLLNDTALYRTELLNIKKIYFGSEVRIYNKNKFHYRNGYILNLGVGLGGYASSFFASINKRFSNKFEVGLGIGNLDNYYELPINYSSILIRSTPIYLHAKYLINEGKRMWYINSKAGYTLNRKMNQLDASKNGILIEPGFGLIFSSKSRTKHYFQLSQSISKASGTFTFIDMTSNIPITGGYNIWFNGTFFTYGIEIGR